jgi:uncharacterized protein YqfB (UPF0267 family)
VNVIVNASVYAKQKIMNIYAKIANLKITVLVNVIANIYVDIPLYYIILFVFALILKALELSKELVNKIYKWH